MILTCRGLTLVELLVVIAIIAITTAGISFTYVVESRVAKALDAQTRTLEQLAQLERAWRADVRLSVVGRELETTSSFAMQLHHGDGSSAERRVYTAAELPDERINITRMRVAPDGRELSRQLLATVDSVEFSITTSPTLCRLDIMARSGFDSYRSTQRRSILACPAGVTP